MRVLGLLATFLRQALDTRDATLVWLDQTFRETVSKHLTALEGGRRHRAEKWTSLGVDHEHLAGSLRDDLVHHLLAQSFVCELHVVGVDLGELTELLSFLISSHDSKVVGVLELLSVALVTLLEEFDYSLTVSGELLVFFVLAIGTLETAFLGSDLLPELSVLVLDLSDVLWEGGGSLTLATEAVGGARAGVDLGGRVRG